MLKEEATNMAGFRFRKRRKIGPVEFDITKEGIAVSIGRRGLRIGLSQSGRLYAVLGISGLGIWYTRTIGRIARGISWKQTRKDDGTSGSQNTDQGSV